MKDIDEEWPNSDYALVPGWYSAAQHLRGSDRVALMSWLKTTDGGRFWEGGTRIWFEREEDLVLFKLTWF